MWKYPQINMKIYRNENPRGQTLVIMYDKRPNLNIFNNINKTDRSSFYQRWYTNMDYTMKYVVKIDKLVDILLRCLVGVFFKWFCPCWAFKILIL